MFLSKLRRISFNCRSLVAREPSLWLLYQPYIWWAKLKRSRVSRARECVVHNRTELVIDGFQGSANSFATYAFKAAQTDSVELTHHLHSPAQIIDAVSKDIPVLLTIREPENTVISLTRRWPHLSVEQGLKGYIKFYKKLKPYKEQMIVSTFESTTQQLDEIIKLINQKFHRSFSPVDVSQASQERLLRKQKSKQSKEEIAAIKIRKREEMSNTYNKTLLQQANNVYRDFLELETTAT